MGGLDVGDPVADRLVDGVFEGAATTAHRGELGAEEFHAEDVGRLAADVLFAHVDDAFEPEHGADRGGGDAVLSGAGLGDDPALPHALTEESLAEGAVDLVSAGVGEVFSLEVDACAAELVGEVLGEVDRRGAAGVGAREAVELSVEGLVLNGGLVGLLKLFERRHQGLGDELAAELAEAPGGVGDGGGKRGCHNVSAARVGPAS